MKASRRRGEAEWSVLMFEVYLEINCVWDCRGVVRGWLTTLDSPFLTTSLTGSLERKKKGTWIFFCFFFLVFLHFNDFAFPHSQKEYIIRKTHQREHHKVKEWSKNMEDSFCCTLGHSVRDYLWRQRKNVECEDWMMKTAVGTQNTEHPESKYSQIRKHPFSIYIQHSSCLSVFDYLLSLSRKKVIC